MRKDHRERELAILSEEGNYSKAYKDKEGKSQACLEYAMHHKIRLRTSNSKTQEHRPTYKGCAMSTRFEDYNYFVRWCRCQIGFNTAGWVLDKDILSYGSKIYSEDTCVFIPMCINSFLTFTKRRNKSGYCGVSYQNTYSKSGGRYIVSCAQLNGKNKTLGRVEDPYQGWLLYREEKIRLAKVLAEEWEGKIDNRAYDFLINFEDHIDALVKQLGE